MFLHLKNLRMATVAAYVALAISCGAGINNALALTFPNLHMGTQNEPALVPPTATAPIAIEPTHVKYLKMAYEIGKQFGLSETLQGILLVESNAGRAPIADYKLPVAKRSYGIMQVQPGAARSVFTRVPHIMEQFFPHRSYKSITDSEIIKLLSYNAEANLIIATHHLNIYMTLASHRWDVAVAGYNMGIGGALRSANHAQRTYVKKVKRYIQQIVHPFNDKYFR